MKKKYANKSEILKINNEIQKRDNQNEHLQRGFSSLSIRVLNIENIVTNIKNKPDRKIISIYAGIDGPLRNNQQFRFGDGGGYYVMNYPGKILGIGLVSFRTNMEDVSVMMTVNNKETYGYGISLGVGMNGYHNFDTPFEVKAGDLISFVSKSNNYSCINTLASLIIELLI